MKRVKIKMSVKNGREPTFKDIMLSFASIKNTVHRINNTICSVEERLCKVKVKSLQSVRTRNESSFLGRKPKIPL